MGNWTLHVEPCGKAGYELTLAPEALIVAGWTGRDSAAVQAHVDELAEIGVAPPRTVPMFYRLDPRLLTSATALQVVGRESSGEAEVVLIAAGSEWLVTVGSDHTDRKLEATGVTLSKQLCGKPIAAKAWRWRDVADHWEALTLRSILPRSGESYQEGSVAALRRPDDLLRIYEERHGPVNGAAVIFCGTLPVAGGVRFADRFRAELDDPVLGRTLSHEYSVEALPIAEDE